MCAVAGVDNILIIPSGSPPPNPTELLASARMDQILLEAGREVDVIVVDCPPSLVTDYQVLSTKTDGVLMVIQPGMTHADTAFAMLEQLGRVNAHMLGVVLNKIPRNSRHFGGYHHYSGNPGHGGYYYQVEKQSQPQLQAEDRPVRSFSQVQPHDPYPVKSITQTEQFPIELISPTETQTAKQLPVTDPQPVEFSREQKDALEEMYNAIKSHERAKMALAAQDISVTEKVFTRSKLQNEDLLPVVMPKYTIEKYELEYAYIRTEQEKDER